MRRSAESARGRERPWQASQVGIDIGALDSDPAARTAETAVLASPDELRGLVDRIQDLLRPHLRTVRDDAPTQAALVHVGLRAFPRQLHDSDDPDIRAKDSGRLTFAGL